MLPAQPMRLEAGEVSVSGDPGADFRDGKRGMPGVGDQLSCGRCDAAKSQHVLQVRGHGRGETAAGLCGQLLDCG